jgi:peptidoglycan/LPS O-acetylase OafA/YrhL
MIEKVRKPTKRIFGLDLLRVISIALVLCSHTSWIYPPSSSLLSKAVDMCGFFGVELFFVMSGYLIGGIIFRQFISDDYSFKTTLAFLYRRLMRILPNYYLIILVNMAIWSLVGYSLSEAWKYFFFFQNFASPLLPFFPESWSLPIKEYGYVIAVLLLYVFSVLFARVPRKSLFLVVIIGMIIFFFTSKIYYNLHTHNTTMQQWDISLRSVVIYRIDTVLLGVLAGYIASEYPQFWKKQQLRFAAAGFLLTAALLFCLGYLKLKILDFPLFWNVLCLPINAVALVCFLPFFSQWKTASARYTKPIEFISEISYAVYLLHYSIVLFLLKHFINSSTFTMMQLHLLTLAYLSITFFLSYLMYMYFERPMMKLRDIKFNYGK